MDFVLYEVSRYKINAKVRKKQNKQTKMLRSEDKSHEIQSNLKTLLNYMYCEHVY